MTLRKVYTSQAQRFDGLLDRVARDRRAWQKIINPDSDILRNLKSWGTETLVRIYTGNADVDDWNHWPDPYQHGRAYAERVYRAVQDPAHMGFLEYQNEPQDYAGIGLSEFIRRLNASLVGFAERARELGFKPVGPNVSTGYPEVYVPDSDYMLWPNAWQGLQDGLREIIKSGGMLSVHEYDAPDLFRLWSDSHRRGYLVGRILAVQEVLTPDLRAAPWAITEFGIDWVVHGEQGGFWYRRDEDAPTWMADQMRQCWSRVYQYVPNLQCICFFLEGRDNDKWRDYDIARTTTSADIFSALFAEGVEAPEGLPTMPTPRERLDHIWGMLGIDYNPEASFPKTAKTLGLGRPVTQEDRYDAADGERIAVQGFDAAFLECREGDWSNAKAYDYLTGELYQADAKPPTDLVLPPVFETFGYRAIEGVPVEGEPFYRLAPTGAVRRGVSAFAKITVIGLDGGPLPGVQVVQRRADGKGEVLDTDGTGSAQFNFGSGAAFEPPGQAPPLECFIASGAVRDEDSRIVSWDKVLSDRFFYGDTNGEHTEIFAQFVQKI